MVDGCWEGGDIGKRIIVANKLFEVGRLKLPDRG
jgi:hypothetical protein